MPVRATFCPEMGLAIDTAPPAFPLSRAGPCTAQLLNDSMPAPGLSGQGPGPRLPSCLSITCCSTHTGQVWTGMPQNSLVGTSPMTFLIIGRVLLFCTLFRQFLPRLSTPSTAHSCYHTHTRDQAKLTVQLGIHKETSRAEELIVSHCP